MLRRFMFLSLAMAGLCMAYLAHAAERATPEEAKAMAEKAAAHMAEVGPAKAIADFNDPAGGFVDRELFVVTYGPDNKILSSVEIPVLLGKDVTTLKDVEGRPFGKEIIELANTRGSGWVDYRMTNPATKKIGLKTSWVVRVGDYILFVGAYKT